MNFSRRLPHITSADITPPLIKRAWIVSVMLFLLTLIPPALPHNIYTVDETRVWLGRTTRFSEALATGNLPETIQTHHPGVLTMWLGSAGMLIDKIANPDGTLHNALRMYYIRLPSVLYNALGLVAAYWLLRLLLGDTVAFFGSVLWALDPFMVAHRGILHIDALSTTSAALALLLMMVALSRDHERRSLWLVTAGIMTGLAALAKFTLFFMLGMVPLLVLIYGWRAGLRAALWRMITATTIVTVAALLTFIVLYPGLWAAPERFLMETWDGITNSAFSPHENGNFYWGQRVDDDPGLSFYPVAFFFRTTPWVMVGLALLPLAAWAYPARQRWHLLVLALFVLLFTAFMTVQAKKFDRYLLQIYPVVNVLAGAALLVALRYLSSRDRILRWLVIALCVGQLAVIFPNELSYYNPLLGGGRVAQNILYLGWGQGYGEAARFIASREGEGCFNDVAVASATLYEQYLPQGCEVENLSFNSGEILDLDDVDYVITYSTLLQRRDDIADYLAPIEPLHRVVILGAEYVRIYAAEDIRAYYPE